MVATRKEWGDSRARQTGVAHAAFDHPAHVAGGHCVFGELLCAADRRCGRAVRRAGPGAVGGGKVAGHELLQVVPHRDLAGLAAFLSESQAVLVAGVEVVADSESGDRADSRRRVDQNADDGPIAKTDDMAGVDASKQPPGLVHRDFRRFALDHLVPLAPDRCCRVQYDSVPGDELVEEMPQGRQVLLFGRHGSGKLVHVLAYVAWRNVLEPNLALLTPLQESVNGSAVSSTRVVIADPPEKELLPGKTGRRTGIGDDGRRSIGCLSSRPGPARVVWLCRRIPYVLSEPSRCSAHCFWLG